MPESADQVSATSVVCEECGGGELKHAHRWRTRFSTTNGPLDEVMFCPKC
jgi:hypothetical protein